MLKRYRPLARSTKPIWRSGPPRKRRPATGPEPFDTLPDGREICRNNSAGNRLYRQRKLDMRTRQGELCCLCGLWMAEEETTFEHAMGRTSGHRDDRIEVNGKRINGAAHLRCNHDRGSKKTPYVLQ